MSTSKTLSQPHRHRPVYSDNNGDDDDFQSPLSLPLTTPKSQSFKPISPNPSFTKAEEREISECGLDSIEPAFEIEFGSRVSNEKKKTCYLSNSLESRLLKSVASFADFDRNSDSYSDEKLGSDDGIESCSDLDVLLKLCDEGGNQLENDDSGMCCPLCRVDISHLPNELREEHTNDCLDKEETPNMLGQNNNPPVVGPGQVVDASPSKSPRQAVDASPVIEWLRGLNLAKYEYIFVQEEIDWDTLQWLTEDDLLAIGITTLGPRKKIVHALGELRKGSSKKAETRSNASADVTKDGNRAANKLITDFFPGSTNHKRKESLSKGGHEIDKSHLHSERKKAVVRKSKDRKLRDIPQWCCIPGTQFRVDAFKYLRSDCSHWFLTHFHMDHYQGLTRSFSHGKIFCSLITAKLVNTKIGIPWDKLQVIPLNQKINVAGIDVTCFDANHCPGAIILLFEPPSGKAVLHTGDFRFSEKMTNIPFLKTCQVQTLVLDTTYCNPQFDFPKQEAVIQFVIEAIQAETFNQKTLFLIGSYTIGKERLFVEVARVLRKKVYVAASKMRILECLGISVEDMKWFTSNEQESHIHVVPMWTLASFKRLKCISNQYARHYSLIVAFSPTGWTFGKGKKKSTGRRWQQGTIVRYEVPYSEHSSFTELKDFVKFISPENIVPSVNNEGLESANAMVSLLLS